MPKGTKTLGNSKALAWESRGFVHKKESVAILTHTHLHLYLKNTRLPLPKDYPQKETPHEKHEQAYKSLPGTRKAVANEKQYRLAEFEDKQSQCCQYKQPNNSWLNCFLSLFGLPKETQINQLCDKSQRQG